MYIKNHNIDLEKYKVFKLNGNITCWRMKYSYFIWVSVPNPISIKFPKVVVHKLFVMAKRLSLRRVSRSLTLTTEKNFFFSGIISCGASTLPFPLSWKIVEVALRRDHWIKEQRMSLCSFNYEMDELECT